MSEDAEMAERVARAAQYFNEVVEQAVGAGLQVSAEYVEPEIIRMRGNPPTLYGGGLKAIVSRVIKPRT